MWDNIFTADSGRHWYRVDGASVKKSESLRRKHWLPTCRNWLAYAPHSNLPLVYERSNSNLKFQRLFKTAEAAMKILDKEYRVRQKAD